MVAVINEHACEQALRRLIGDLDYDLAKALEEDEETGEDHFPALAQRFIRYYEENV